MNDMPVEPFDTCTFIYGLILWYMPDGLAGQESFNQAPVDPTGGILIDLTEKKESTKVIDD